MSYTPTVKFHSEFEDMQFNCALRRISRRDFSKLQVHLSAGTDDGGGDVKINFGSDESFALMDTAAEMLPNYILDWEGDATVEQVIDDMVLLKVFAELFTCLMGSASLGEAETKNSDAPLSKSTAARDTSKPKKDLAGTPSNSGADVSKPVAEEENKGIVKGAGPTEEAI